MLADKAQARCITPSPTVGAEFGDAVVDMAEEARMVAESISFDRPGGV